MNDISDEERAALAKFLIRELLDSFQQSGAEHAPWSAEVVPTLEWVLRALVAQWGPEAIDGNSFDYYIRRHRRTDT